MELRNRIIKIFVLALAIFILSFYASTKILQYFSQTTSANIIATSPTDVIATMFNMSLFITLIITIPYIFHNIVAFVKPAINSKYLLSLPFFSSMMFFSGSLFGYFIALYTANFMSAMANEIGVLNMWSITEYLNFLIVTTLLFGVIFQIPLGMFILNKTGMMPKNYFKKMRFPMLFILLLLIAIISPQGDVVSLIIMGAPMAIIYEIGIVIAR